MNEFFQNIRKKKFNIMRQNFGGPSVAISADIPLHLIVSADVPKSILNRRQREGIISEVVEHYY